MKTSKHIIVAFMLGGFLIGSLTAQVYASGTPAVDFFVPSSTSGIPISFVLVSKYEATSFTTAEAENISQAVGKLLGSTLLSSLSISTSGVSHYNPSQLAAYGITDADVLKNYVKSAYKSWGSYIYVFLDITRVQALMSLGNSLRVDIYIADLDALLGISGNGYLYIASIEVPETYLALLAPA